MKRHVLAVGYVGEWNLKEPQRWMRLGFCDLKIFSRAKAIMGAKRRQGQHARRVRLILEEFP